MWLAKQRFGFVLRWFLPSLLKTYADKRPVSASARLRDSPGPPRAPILSGYNGRVPKSFLQILFRHATV